jgi:hypothetical protein
MLPCDAYVTDRVLKDPPNIHALFNFYICNTSMGYIPRGGGCFLGIKQPGRVANHLPPSSTGVKNTGARIRLLVSSLRGA